jgi:prepilin-type N-terminal cleavage/methylation domain-containing protein
MRGAGGFTLIEFIVVVAIVGMLLVLLFPRFLAFVSDARQSQARQEAMLVGAAIELLKVEGRFDAGDAGLEDMIRARAGSELEGRIVSVDGDGSFVYSRESGGAVYTVAYSSLDGEYYDVAQDVVSDD